LLYAVNSALQAAGDTRVPMLIGICVNAVNAVAAFLLINGPGPFPRLEVAGSGAGFSIAALVGALLGLGVLLSGRRTLRWRPFDGPPLDPREARRILWVGVPTGLEQAQFNIAFMLYTRIVASMGTTAVAAHGVTLAIQGLAFNAGFGISVATSALVGQGLGARRPDLSERATYLAARYALAVTTLVAVVLAVFGRQITSAFVAGEGADEVVDLGGKLMLIFALAMPGWASTWPSEAPCAAPETHAGCWPSSPSATGWCGWCPPTCWPSWPGWGCPAPGWRRCWTSTAASSSSGCAFARAAGSTSASEAPADAAHVLP